MNEGAKALEESTNKIFSDLIETVRTFESRLVRFEKDGPVPDLRIVEITQRLDDMERRLHNIELGIAIGMNLPKG